MLEVMYNNYNRRRLRIEKKCCYCSCVELFKFVHTRKRHREGKSNFDGERTFSVQHAVY